MEDVLNKASLAIQLEISRPTLDKLLRNIPPIKTEGNEVFYSLKACQELIQTKESKAKREQTSPDSLDKKSAETRKLNAQAEKLEMEVLKYKSNLVMVADVVEPIADALHSVRSKILNISIKTAPHISLEVRTILDGFINECLEEIASIDLDRFFNGQETAISPTETSIPKDEAANQGNSKPVGGS